MKRIVLIIGARPNFMKAFPVYEALKKRHSEYLHRFFKLNNIKSKDNYNYDNGIVL